MWCDRFFLLVVMDICENVITWSSNDQTMYNDQCTKCLMVNESYKGNIKCDPYINRGNLFWFVFWI